MRHCRHQEWTFSARMDEVEHTTHLDAHPSHLACTSAELESGCSPRMSNQTKDLESRSQANIRSQTPFGLNRFLLLTIIIGYSICIGPHFFNWIPWEKILLNAGAFQELCPSNDICSAQEEKIASLLPLTAAVMFCFTFLAGILLDTIGPKICCLFGSFLFICGWLSLSIASKSRNTYAIGFALMGAGTVNIIYIQPLICSATGSCVLRYIKYCQPFPRI